MGTPITEMNVGRMRLEKEIEQQHNQAKKEFAAITCVSELAPPAQPHSRAVTPDLDPESMASRIPGLLSSASYGLIPGELLIGRMDSRIGSSSIAT